MLTIALAESTVTNSLGRAISLALVARELGPVELWAVDDGPPWIGARHFDVDLRPFRSRRLDLPIDRILAAAEHEPVLVWVSKGLSPLDRIARAVRGRPNVTVIADFDDDDVSLMREQMRKLKTAIHLNVTHRKSPVQIARAQARTASVADAYTFSSDVLRRTYESRGFTPRPSAVVPHARPTSWLVPERDTRRPGPLRLGYLGTIRPHKGADAILDLVRAMPDIEFTSFAGSFRPPAGGATWREIPSDAMRLEETYAGLDFVLVPQNPASSAARNQLPSKIIEAAAFGTAVVATPTPVIEEYCAGAYLPIDDWSDAPAVAARIRAADPIALGAAIRQRFVDRFAVEGSAKVLTGLLEGEPQRGVVG